MDESPAHRQVDSKRCAVSHELKRLAGPGTRLYVSIGPDALKRRWPPAAVSDERRKDTSQQRKNGHGDTFRY